MAEESIVQESADNNLFDFGLEPLPTPPTTSSVLALVSEIIDSVPDSWKLSKSSPNYSTAVYHKVLGTEPWFVRRSVHSHPFEWFKRALYHDHFENVVKYYDVVKSASLKEEREAWRGYTLKYKLPSPFADRDIAEWLLTHIPEDNEHEFIIVAVPADIPLPEDAITRGVYSFFHRVRKTENNDVEWIIGQTSDMKGNLPRWVQNMSIAGILVNDVQSFVDWMDENYGSQKGSEEDDDDFQDAE
ncbi:hypothetical protein V1507DRAFT_53126 [Lipomyces tetrasporus]